MEYVLGLTLEKIQRWLFINSLISNQLTLRCTTLVTCLYSGPDVPGKNQ